MCTETLKYSSRYIYLDSYKLEQVREFPYLNSMITSDGNDTREIKRSMRMAKKVFSKKYELFTSEN